MTRMNILVLGLLALFVPRVFAAEEETAVVVLTEKTFDEFIKNNPVSLIEFFAPWCGHCKSLAPEYEKAAKILKEKDSIPLGSVDATVEKELGTRFQIRGFPTLKIFRNGEPEEYRGGRTADSIVSYIEQVTGPAVVVASSKDDVEKIIKENAVVYVGRFTKGEGDEKHDIFTKVADSHRTKGKFVTYVSADVDAHGEVHAHRKDEEAPKHEIKDSEALGEFIANEFFPLFGAISGENYSDYAARDIEMVWYCGGPDDFEKVSKVVREVAKDLRGTYSFVWLDSDQFGSHAEGALGINEFPGMVLQAKKGRYLFPHKDLKVENMKSFFSDVESGKIQRTIKSEDIPEKNDEPVKVVVANNFEDLVFQKDKDVMLEVYAPWCGHCKKLEPIFTEFAEKLEKSGVDHVVVAKMDGTANESPSDEFEWTGFPTLFYVRAGEKTPMRYDGARTTEGLIEFIKKKSSKEVNMKEEKKTEKEEEVKEEL
eukprot:Selendium_serpulae@DN6072_c0_g1_i1.p1